MRFKDLQEDIVDLTSRRQAKQNEKNARSVQDAADAIQGMKDDFHVVINSTIDSLVNAGMSEDKATLVVMSYMSDLVMGHDISSQ